MTATVRVTGVRLLQGEQMRSCSTCGEVEHVVWFMEIDRVPTTRCTVHSSIDVYTAALGEQYAASIAKGAMVDDDLGSDLIRGVYAMLERVGARADGRILDDAWAIEIQRLSPSQRVKRARFLIGAAAFALQP